MRFCVDLQLSARNYHEVRQLGIRNLTSDLSLLLLASEIFHHLNPDSAAFCLVYLQGIDRATVRRGGQIYELHLSGISMEPGFGCL